MLSNSTLIVQNERKQKYTKMKLMFQLLVQHFGNFYGNKFSRIN